MVSRTDEIKAALLNREFDLAESLIQQWSLDFSLQLSETTDKDDRRQILEAALTLGEENVCLARVVRAQIASELQSNSASFLYFDADLEQPRWRISA